MIGVNKRQEKKMNSVYYTTRKFLPKKDESIANYNAQSSTTPGPPSIPIQQSRPLPSFAVTTPQPRLGERSVVTANKPVLNGGPQRALDEAQQKAQEARSELIEKILQAQESEIAGLREEIEQLTAAVSWVSARFVADAPMNSPGDDGGPGSIAKGTQIVLRGPYEQNDEGIWGTSQVLTLGQMGLEIKAYSVMIARRLNVGSADERYEPLVEIIGD